MKQLVQLQERYDEFDSIDTVVLAVAQEDKDLETHGRMLSHFEPLPRFVLLADLDRKDTGRYERTSTYFIDRDGVIRQIFPQFVRYRATWDAILPELRRQLGKDAPNAPTKQSAAAGSGP